MLAMFLLAGNARAQIVTAVDEDTSTAGPFEPAPLAESDPPPRPDLSEGLRAEEGNGVQDEADERVSRRTNRFDDLRDYIAPGRRSSRFPDNGLRLQRRGSVFGRNHEPFSEPLHEAAHDPTESVENHLDLRFHIEWGGKTAEWEGEISVDQGRIAEVDHLGVEPMAPGHWNVAASSLRFRQAAPRTYDAIALTVRAVEGASLTWRLTTAEIETTRTIPLRELISEPYGIRLGGSNRLTIRRAPGDALRVRLDRSSMIVEPSERINVAVQLNSADNDLTEPHRCRLQLVNPRSDMQLWISELDTAINRQDTPGEIGPFTVPMPRDEGVYELVISLDPREGSAPFKNAGWRHTRRLQFVVFAAAGKRGALFASRAAPPSQGWQVVHDIDPTAGKVVAATSPLSVFGSRTQASNTFGTSVGKPRQIGGSNFATLKPGGWLAFPIGLEAEGKPHRIEIEYPGEVSQRFGIAIVEPTADGRAMRPALDTGLDVDRLPGETPSVVASARSVFWPQSERAFVVVTNRSTDKPAIVGSIRIHAGPAALNEDKPTTNRKQRLVAATLRASELTRLFGSQRVRDERSGRFLTDWQTFWTAATRLAEVLHDRGYNGAMIEVAGDGGTLYPTELWPALTGYDNGVLFHSGQDPMRKDVLELLFRVFDRQGLRLVPSIRFSTPLEQLETQQDDREQTPLLVDDLHQPWHVAHPDAAVGPVYNPLNDRVQKAMRRVVKEIADRYGEHPSFAGVSLDISGRTYARLPGAAWGLDSATENAFISSTGASQVNGSQVNGSQGSRHPMVVEVSDRWLTWRAAEMASFYQRLSRELPGSRPELRLFLAGDDLLKGLQPSSKTSPDLLPTPPAVATLLIEQGIDAAAFAKLPGIVLLRPLDAGSTEVKSYDADAAQTIEIDEAFLSSGEHQGGLVNTRANTVSLTSPRAAKVLGVGATEIRLRPYVGLAGARGAQPVTHLLASQDCRSIFVDGLVRLREAGGPAQRATELLRGLPIRTLSKQGQAAPPQAQPLTIRRLPEAGQARLYVANDSPWPIQARLRFQSSAPYKMTELSAGKQSGDEDRPDWQLSVPPYDVASCTLSRSDVQIAAVQTEHGENLTSMLEAEIGRLERNLSRMRRWDVLPAGSFEPVKNDSPLSEWRVSEGADLRVAVDSTQAANGEQSLLMESRTPVGWSRGPVAWFRSHYLQAPGSGRLAMQAQVRVADARQQPRVRLVVEGQADGQRFYRQVEYGSGEGLPALSEQWQKVGMVVDDLPQGEIRNLRVGVDLRGTGQVWVDDVRLFDVWLTRAEATFVSEQLRQASACLAEGRFQDCRHTLQRAGPQYLRYHFGDILTAEAARKENTRASRQSLHREIARAPAAVMTSRPARRPAPREIGELQTVAIQDASSRELRRRSDSHREAAPRVLREGGNVLGHPAVAPPGSQRLQRLPSTGSALPASDTAGAPSAAAEQNGFMGWFDKIFARQSEPAAAPSRPSAVRRQHDSLFRQLRRSREAAE